MWKYGAFNVNFFIVIGVMWIGAVGKIRGCESKKRRTSDGEAL